MNSHTGNSRRTSSKTTIRRKYLGDASDPHFIPDSPIISRQSLTFEEEEELTKVCTLVLSGVPTSDDNEEDPLMKYIANHLAAKQPKAHQEKEKGNPIYLKTSISTGNEFANKQQHVRRINDETATPSTNSKRDTIDRTNTSTPLTVLSETMRRPSSTRQNNAIRNESKSSNCRVVYGLADKKNSNDISILTSNANKSTSFIPTSSALAEQNSTRMATDKVGTLCISRVEFNKSLPALPETLQSAKPVARQSRGFSRIFRSNKRSDSKDIATTPTVPVRRSTEFLPPQTAHSGKIPKRQSFNFISLFDRRRKPQPTHIAVS